MTREPDIRELVGEDLPSEEAERLRRVHELLVAAGPLPELPPGLEQPRTEREQREPAVVMLPRRRTGAALALAAAIALVAFLGGYLAGYRKHNDTGAASFTAAQKITLHGTSRAPNAVAVVEVGRKDASGNLPMLITTRGLRRLPPSGYYTLALTKGGKPVVACGTFRVRSGNSRTTVRMAVAYDVTRFDGWVVTEYEHGRTAEPVVLTS
jgi:hypothetical protein